MIKLNRQVENLEDIINKIEMKIEELEKNRPSLIMLVTMIGI